MISTVLLLLSAVTFIRAFHQDTRGKIDHSLYYSAIILTLGAIYHKLGYIASILGRD